MQGGAIGRPAGAAGVPNAAGQQQQQQQRGQYGTNQYGLEAARQQNLDKILEVWNWLLLSGKNMHTNDSLQLQQTLEAAQQAEAQYKSQMEIMNNVRQIQDSLHYAQQQEQHFKHMEVRISETLVTEWFRIINVCFQLMQLGRAGNAPNQGSAPMGQNSSMMVQGQVPMNQNQTPGMGGLGQSQVQMGMGQSQVGMGQGQAGMNQSQAGMNQNQAGMVQNQTGASMGQSQAGMGTMSQATGQGPASAGQVSMGDYLTACEYLLWYHLTNTICRWTDGRRSRQPHDEASDG